MDFHEDLSFLQYSGCWSNIYASYPFESSLSSLPFRMVPFQPQDTRRNVLRLSQIIATAARLPFHNPLLWTALFLKLPWSLRFPDLNLVYTSYRRYFSSVSWTTSWLHSGPHLAALCIHTLDSNSCRSRILVECCHTFSSLCRHLEHAFLDIW